MNASNQTIQKIERALRKTIAKCPQKGEEPVLTDIYLQVTQEGGELLVFDDDDHELTRCVVEEWIGNTSETFYEDVQPILHGVIESMRKEIDTMNLLRPYSFVLMGEEHDIIADLYLVDDDAIVISGELMAGLEEDLNKFWHDLMAQQ